MDYETRFVPAPKVPALLDCWRMTAVGWSVHPDDTGVRDPHTRYGRMQRASRAFVRQHPGVTTDLGAYKDLDGLLGEQPGRILA